MADLLTTLDGYDVTLVEVRCAPEELDRRERVRADRTIGLARSQTSVYRIGEFDIVVDTTRSSADECATAIIHAFGVLPLVKAFDRLRARRDS